MRSRKASLFGLVALLVALAMALPAGAQGEMGTPSVEVADQVVLDRTVTITEFVSDGPG